MLLRQFELRHGGEALVTWLAVEDTGPVRVGTVISLADSSKRWTVGWRGTVTLDSKDVRKKRFTNSAVRDRDGHWVL